MVKDFRSIPIFINARDLLTPLERLVTWLLDFDYHKIYILDNDSSYPPLLEYYDAIRDEVTVLPLKANVGHTSLWELKILERLDITTPFVFTDPDIVPIDECPRDVLAFFLDILRAYPHKNKVGFGLMISDLPDHYRWKEQVIAWESQFWEEDRRIIPTRNRPNNRATSRKVADPHFAEQPKGEMRPFRRGRQGRRTAQIRGDFVPPNGKAKSLMVPRTYRGPVVFAGKWFKWFSGKVFSYFAAHDMNVEFRPTLYDSPIDTTFALYRPGSAYDISGIRTGFPYLARHYPWYQDSECPSAEQSYYVQHARPGINNWSGSQLLGPLDDAIKRRIESIEQANRFHLTDRGCVREP